VSVSTGMGRGEERRSWVEVTHTVYPYNPRTQVHVTSRFWP